MNFFKKIMPAALGLFLITGVAFAQGQQSQQAPQVSSEDINDQELEALADIAMKQRTIQQEANQEVQQALNEYESIDMQRFRTLMMSKRNPQAADSVEMTENEKAAMKELQPKLTKINQSAQKEMMAMIQDSELSRQRLQSIQQALRSDKDLQKRFQQVMMEKQKESAGSNDS